MARRRRVLQGTRRRYGTMSIVSIVVVLGILVAINYLGARQNKRWDLTANQVYSLSDQTIKILQRARRAGARSRCSSGTSGRTSHPRPARGVHLPLDEADDGIRRSRPRADARRGGKIQTLPTIVFEYKGRTERIEHVERAGHHQRPDQGDHRRGAQGLLHAGPRREGHGATRARRLQPAAEAMKQRQLRRRAARADPADDGARRRDRSWSSPARRPISSRRRSRRSTPTSRRAAR